MKNIFGEAIAFLIPLRDNPEGYDLFILCCVQGIDLNNYVREVSTPWAFKLSDCLLLKANQLLLRTLDMAMDNLWKDRLWNKYMVPHACDDETSSDIAALRSLSNVVSVSKLDERFASLLSGNDANFKFDFNELETAMKSDILFSHWSEVSLESGSICYVIYFESEKGYLLLHREVGGSIRECEILLKTCRDNPIPMIRSFGKFFLLWVYNNAEVW